VEDSAGRPSLSEKLPCERKEKSVKLKEVQSTEGGDNLSGESRCVRGGGETGRRGKVVILRLLWGLLLHSSECHSRKVPPGDCYGGWE
jgi:hypothetical protein